VVRPVRHELVKHDRHDQVVQQGDQVSLFHKYSFRT
jgi:hypothetical protein